MRSGARIIYQGALRNENTGWFGKPDFLLRVDQASRLGAWSYEVVDAKLAREAKGGALLQLLVYADLLEAVQGVPPPHVHLALGGPEPRKISFRTADYAAYFRALRRRFEEYLSNAPDSLPIAADPVAHCDICSWHYQCDDERRGVDHLSLVAGIAKMQRRALVETGSPCSISRSPSAAFDHPPSGAFANKRGFRRTAAGGGPPRDGFSVQPESPQRRHVPRPRPGRRRGQSLALRAGLPYARADATRERVLPVRGAGGCASWESVREQHARMVGLRAATGICVLNETDVEHLYDLDHVTSEMLLGDVVLHPSASVHSSPAYR
jgi:hypothetical protein